MNLHTEKEMKERDVKELIMNERAFPDLRTTFLHYGPFYIILFMVIASSEFDAKISSFPSNTTKQLSLCLRARQPWKYAATCPSSVAATR